MYWLKRLDELLAKYSIKYMILIVKENWDQRFVAIILTHANFFIQIANKQGNFSQNNINSDKGYSTTETGQLMLFLL